jgi:hypothetical protein
VQNIARKFKYEKPRQCLTSTFQHNSTSESKDNELTNMLEKGLVYLLLIMIRDLKEDSYKQIIEVSKSIQDLRQENQNYGKEIQQVNGNY